MTDTFLRGLTLLQHRRTPYSVSVFPIMYKYRRIMASSWHSPRALIVVTNTKAYAVNTERRAHWTHCDQSDCRTERRNLPKPFTRRNFASTLKSHISTMLTLHICATYHTLTYLMEWLLVSHASWNDCLCHMHHILIILAMFNKCAHLAERAAVTRQCNFCKTNISTIHLCHIPYIHVYHKVHN